MNEVSLCIALGGVISLAVSFAKNLAIVKTHPKVVVALLSALVAVGEAYFTGDGFGLQSAELVRCFLIQFTAAVATHEVVTHEVQKHV